MKITDNAGKTHDVRALVWNGVQWQPIPERIYKNQAWWIIQYFIPSIAVNLFSLTNIDDVMSISITLTATPT